MKTIIFINDTDLGERKGQKVHKMFPGISRELIITSTLSRHFQTMINYVTDSSSWTYLPFRKSPPVPLTLPSWVPWASVVIVVVVVSTEDSPSPFLLVRVTFFTFLIPATPVVADILAALRSPDVPDRNCPESRCCRSGQGHHGGAFLHTKDPRRPLPPRPGLALVPLFYYKI